MNVWTSESGYMNVWTSERSSYNSQLLEALEAHEDIWKAHQVHFPMPQSTPHLDVTIKSYVWISQDCLEG